MGLSKRLSEIIEESKLTDYRIAKDINVSASTIATYRKGSKHPDLTKMDKLCEYLGVELEWLKTGEGSKYILGEHKGDYARTEKSEEKTADALIKVIQELTASIRERDTQITELIKKLE
ncbi:helix-turn-helix domain-containing protein [Odoribacter sp. OttesenSCG-928-A06]|nr:helix-turn-helix domain-containing protein [Odoribacter sp. OttesenSCG-928-A06]